MLGHLFDTSPQDFTFKQSVPSGEAKLLSVFIG
jgi:hypothetical protein